MGSVGMACAVLFIVAVTVSGVLTAAIHGEAQLGHPATGSSVSQLHFQHLVKRSAGNPQKLCGTRLVDALRSVCAQRFYTQKRRSGSSNGGGSSTGGYKSEDGGDGFDGFGWDSLGFDPASAQYGQSALGDAYWDKDSDVVVGAGSSSDVELFWPHNPKSLTYKVLTEGTSHNRVRRSIVEDCCMRSCTLNQMVKYCAVSG